MAAKPDDAEPTVWETTVCGLGTVQYDDHEHPLYGYIDQATASAQSRWRKRLIDSTDAHVHAAGLLLQTSNWVSDPVSQLPAPTQEATAAVDELVQEAAGGNDVQVYAMAMRACDNMRLNGAPRPSCARASVAKWAQLEPDNAAPWLELAAAAHERSDTSAQAQAVAQALKAHRVDFYNDAVLTVAPASMPPGTNDLEQAAFFYRLIGHKGSDGGALSFVRSFCGVYTRANAAATIPQPCEGLANLLAEHGRSTSEWSTAAAVGGRLGWAPERIGQMNQEMMAIFRVELTYGAQDPWSCGYVRALNAFAAIQGRSGELAAGRDSIKKSGQTVEALAEAQRQDVARPCQHPKPGAGMVICLIK